MKTRNIISAICLVFTINQVYAQAGIGIKGGMNFSQIYTNTGSIGTNISQSLDTKTGWAFGIYGRVGHTFFLQPELMVSSTGGSIDVVPANNTTATPIKLDVKFTNLELPILIGFQPIKYLRVMAGPVAAFKIGDNQNIQDALKSYTTSFDYASKSAVWGYQLGVGIHVLGLDIDLRRQGGLSDVSFLNVKNTTSTQRAAGWQLSVAFKLI